ncbi:MAG: hypothetical protein K6G11_02675 [Lachnospiraceae bacterium]|nr:hypothetical protein [Lachnospiraceae bacterium]
MYYITCDYKGKEAGAVEQDYQDYNAKKRSMIFRIMDVIVYLLAIIGLAGTVFSFAVFMFGGSSKAKVTQVQRNTKNTVITYEYKYEGNTFSKNKRYKKGKKIKIGDKLDVYYLKEKPEIGFTMNGFAVFYFLLAIFGPISSILYKQNKRKNE